MLFSYDYVTQIKSFLGSCFTFVAECSCIEYIKNGTSKNNLILDRYALNCLYLWFVFHFIEEMVLVCFNAFEDQVPGEYPDNVYPKDILYSVVLL